jgi:uncharacterized protein (DUF924 family)
LKRVEEILQFWFGESLRTGVVPAERLQFWFGGQEQTDQQIRDLFQEDLRRAMGGEYDHWRQSPRGRLALIILLDQFPRNIHRHLPEAYASDEKALGLCLEGMERGHDRRLHAIERAFFYLPLEHSEEPAMQERSVQVFADLLAAAPEQLKELCRGFHDYAVRHRDIIARFGRFPHRNSTLGRPSSTEEVAFLKEPGSSF